MNWRIADPAHLLSAIRISLAQGGEYLASRVAPNGPILTERNVNYIHKASWGMYAAGVDHATIAKMLDWAESEALRPNGDFYFPEEGPKYKDFQRVYRPMTFGKVAAWIGHPVIRKPVVIDRILQYQHQPSGGVFHYIGDDPDNVQEQVSIGTLNTSFFGHLMVALDIRDRATNVGDWLVRWVDANRGHLPAGRLYTQMTPGGELITNVGPGEELSKLVDTQRPKQEFWNAGTAMAYLLVLYDAMRGQWDCEEAESRPYLDAAKVLLDFDAAMPLDTYLWPSKCKAGWGAGEMLRVLVKYFPDDKETMEKAYHVAERTAIFTFLDNQLPDGSWSQMHYPLDSRIPEMAFSYKPLKNIVRVPQEFVEGSKTIWLPAEELSGEILGEMKVVEEGLAAWLE